MDGYIPTENLRFRDTALTFRVVEKAMDVQEKREFRSEYQSMTKTLGRLLSVNLKKCDKREKEINLLKQKVSIFKNNFKNFIFVGNFHLTVEGGEFSDSEIIVLMGENGTGKTIFIRLLAGKLQPDQEGMHNFNWCTPEKYCSNTTCRDYLFVKIVIDYYKHIEYF